MNLLAASFKNFAIILIALLAFNASAKSGAADSETPCKKIIDACKANTVSKGDAKDKKGLFKNCVRPIMRGEKIAGVDIAPADVDACRAKKRSMPNFK